MSTDQSTVNQTPTTVEKLRGLPWGVAWSVTNSVFVSLTFFGSIFVLYLNELQLDKGQIGVLLSLLPFFGIIAVFIAGTVARWGYKRVFLSAFTARSAMGILLLLCPLVLAQFGQVAVLAFVLVTVAAFGLFRAIGFTAFYPWQQEQVPDAVRGRNTAIGRILSSLATLVAITAAGYILGSDPDLSHFVLPIGAGVAFGFASVWAAAKIPGGAPSGEGAAEQSSLREMVASARDSNFVRYLTGAGLITLALVPLASFVPLFMEEEVGLTTGQVVWLETGVLLGGLLSALLWGWLADRYGSKPVMATSVLLLPLLPLAWLLMPRQVPLSLYLALAIAFVQGIVHTGWTLASARILFVSVVPAKKRASYLALHYAWMGIAGGLGLLAAGWLVELAGDVSAGWGIVTIDPYTPLFLAGMVFPLVAFRLFSSLRADSTVTTKQFAGMFLRGNPLLAMESLIRYHRARDERAAVAMTERLGSTKSPLTDEELIEALHDPRFYVRFEAIVSMARRDPDPRLTEALIETLEGSEPALSTLAAWALGRIGDEHALEALRAGLNASYRSVQAHCARSLGSLGDRSVLPILLQRLEVEQDLGLQLALASALGKLGAAEAVDRLLELLRTANSMDARQEFALALGRLTGEEHRFIELQRKAERDPGTVFSQTVSSLRTRLAKSGQSNAELEDALDAAAEVLAHDDLPQGVNLICAALQLLPADQPEQTCHALIRECISCLDEFGSRRLEYVVLALHAVDCWLSD
jgi:HEAT repeat protein/sugar phosphate permease